MKNPKQTLLKVDSKRAMPNKQKKTPPPCCNLHAISPHKIIKLYELQTLHSFELIVSIVKLLIIYKF